MTDPVNEPAAAPQQRRAWVVPLALFAGTFVVYALTARHGGGSWDYYTANFASWHIVHTGSPWIDGVNIKGLSGTHSAMIWIKEANGHTVISRFPGVIAISLPAYFIARPDSMTVIPGAMTAAVVSALSIVMMYLALRPHLRDKHNVWACLALALGTPIWSISADAIWPHTVTVFGIAGMAWGASSGRWWLAGIFGGITLWGRLHAALIVGLLGLCLAIRRRNARIAVVMGAISIGFLALLGWWTHWMYGSWNPMSSYGEGISDERLHGVLQVV
ncbi:MAG: hypothetical protein ABIO16_14580, partial [Nocardioides sp.]